MFEYLPLGAIIEDKQSANKVFCCHAGIGASFTKLDEIDRINRPLQITLGDINNNNMQMAMDLLWSDPTASEEILGLQNNQQRDPLKQNNIMSYGPDQVEKFLKANSLSMIIRSH